MHSRFFSFIGMIWMVSGLLSFHLQGSQTGDLADEMAAAAKNWLASLSQDQQKQATFGFTSEERLNWHFIPKERKGLIWGEMDPEQKELAMGLLATGMSSKGFTKAVTIMSLEKILQELEGPDRRFPRDPALYHFSIFGEPGNSQKWAWRVEGHHLSLNFTIVGGDTISATPSFFGTNPAHVKSGPRAGVEVLKTETDLGRQLVQSLNAGQKEAAIISTKAPADILTVAEKRIDPLDQKGVYYNDLSNVQKHLLELLVTEYARRNRPQIADLDLHQIAQAGWGRVKFGWAGGMQPGDGHYYFVQGPTFLIEYDNTQNNANHVHAVWREFNGDFGADLLEQHYRAEAHQ